MNALLNITIRVNSQGAREIASMQRQVASMQGLAGGGRFSSMGRGNPNWRSWDMAAEAVDRYNQAIRRSSGGLSESLGRQSRAVAMLNSLGRGFNSATNHMVTFGKRLQWTGQILTMRFSLPIAAALGLGTKLLLDNAQALTRLTKVYEEATPGAFKQELDELSQIALLLSDRFGIARVEVTDTMADFAQAGLTGAAVANMTRKSIEFSIVAEMELAEATKSLITVQQQFGLSSVGLQQALEQLNIVENVTAVRSEELLASLRRGGGVFAQWGVSVAEAAAMTAALVPAFGTAESAGNGLKTMLATLAEPSRAATEAITRVVGAQNLQTFQSARSMDQLRMLAVGFEGLSDAERRFALATIFGNYQVARATALMGQLVDEQSTFNRALNAANDLTRAQAEYRAELEAAMMSDPRRAQIAFTQLQNSLATFVQAILPDLIQFLEILSMLAREFAELDPATRRWIMAAAIALAIIGPLSAYIGSMVALLGILGRTLIFVSKAFYILARAMTVATIASVKFFLAHPYVALALAIVAALAHRLSLA